MRKVASICFLIIFFSACNYKGSEKLEQLKNKITTANDTFQAIEPSLVTKAAKGYNSNLELVKKCVDSAENDFSQAMNNYKGMKKSTPDFFNSYSLTKKNLSNEISQLEMLANDLENNFRLTKHILNISNLIRIRFFCFADTWIITSTS